MKCRKCHGELRPAGYPTFGLDCAKCALLHNLDGTEMKVEPSIKRPTEEEMAKARKEIEWV